MTLPFTTGRNRFGVRKRMDSIGDVLSWRGRHPIAASSRTSPRRAWRGPTGTPGNVRRHAWLSLQRAVSAASGQRPGTLPDTALCTGQQRRPRPDTPTALRLSHPELKLVIHVTGVRRKGAGTDLRRGQAKPGPRGSRQRGGEPEDSVKRQAEKGLSSC